MWRISSTSKLATGPSPRSAIVSPRVADVAALAPTDSISSSATRPTKEIWLSVACSCSGVTRISAASSSSVGLRCRVASSFDVRLLERPGLGPHRARHPVDRAQLVEDRALDARDRVGLELVAAIGVELLDRVDQPEDAVADEVGLLDVLREPGSHAAGHVLHERRVVEDQPVAQLPLSRDLELRPQPVDLRRRAGFTPPQARGWVAPWTTRRRSLET